jgi:hypothetical protein
MIPPPLYLLWADFEGWEFMEDNMKLMELSESGFSNHTEVVG